MKKGAFAQLRLLWRRRSIRIHRVALFEGKWCKLVFVRTSKDARDGKSNMVFSSSARDSWFCKKNTPPATTTTTTATTSTSSSSSSSSSSSLLLSSSSSLLLSSSSSSFPPGRIWQTKSGRRSKLGSISKKVTAGVNLQMATSDFVSFEDDVMSRDAGKN